MKELTAVSREYTVHMHKHCFGRTFKKRAPHAIKVLRTFATKMMKTQDVRIDVDLNKQLWARGIKATATRVRVRLSRKRNDAEDAKEKFYTHVTFVPVASFKGTCLFLWLLLDLTCQLVYSAHPLHSTHLSPNSPHPAGLQTKAVDEE